MKFHPILLAISFGAVVYRILDFIFYRRFAKSTMEKLSRPQSLNELAENAIRKAIVEGQLKFGDHLSEVRLSQMLGISKTPVREALLKMRTEGLIESHPKRGTYVFRVRPEDIDALCEVREVLELAAAAVYPRAQYRPLREKVAGIAVGGRNRIRDGILSLAMRFGLIGYGAWGRHHARAITETSGLELTAIACRNAATAADAQRDFPRARVSMEWKDVVADPALDVIDIVLPNFLHAEVGCAALQAGKDVLLEKPMATTRDDCDRLIRAARTSGRVLSIAHEFRLSTQWGRAKRLIDEDAIGTPLFVNVNLFRNFYRTGA